MAPRVMGRSTSLPLKLSRSDSAANLTNCGCRRDPSTSNISHDHFSTQKGESWSYGEVTSRLPRVRDCRGARFPTSPRTPVRADLCDTVSFFCVFRRTDDHEFQDEQLSPQVTLKYEPSRNLMIYAAYRTGFLPGGFSHGGTPTAGLSPEDFTFESETARGFEAGIRSTLLNGRLRANLTAYSYDYKNLQVSTYVPATASFITDNVGSSRTRGVEGELLWYPTSQFSMRAFVNLMGRPVIRAAPATTPRRLPKAAARRIRRRIWRAVRCLARRAGRVRSALITSIRSAI